MARCIREPITKDILSQILKNILDDSFLMVPGFPDENTVTLFHPDYGACIIVGVDSSSEPVLSEEGAPEGYSVTDLVSKVKKYTGKESASLAFATLFWYPELPPNTPIPKNATVDIIVGAELENIKDIIVFCMKNSSYPVVNKIEFIETALREIPGAKPAKLNKKIKKGNVTVEESEHISENDPMLMLIKHTINAVLENSEIELMGASLTPLDVSSSTGLLPAILVTSAEDWGISDLAYGGKGGFHIYLTTIKKGEDSITGYGLSGIRASTAVVMNLSIVTTLKSCKNSQGVFIIDPLISRFSRFMEMTGYTTLNTQKMLLALLESEAK